MSRWLFWLEQCGLAIVWTRYDMCQILTSLCNMWIIPLMFNTKSNRNYETFVCDSSKYNQPASFKTSPNLLSAFSSQVAVCENQDAKSRGISERQNCICLDLIYLLLVILESQGLESMYQVGHTKDIFKSICSILNLRLELYDF